jgi:caa(3)-type oxidase subunit IV
MKSFYLTYAALLILVAITFGMSYVPLGNTLGTAVGLLIAMAKTLLIIFIFMELATAGKVSKMWFVMGLCWLGILSSILFDYAARSWDVRPQSWAGHGEGRVIGSGPDAGQPSPLEEK